MNFSVLVATSDSYSDCWNPFFKLFDRYWPDYKGIIFLETEFKTYSYSKLNIKALQVSKNHCVSPGKQPTWSKRLKWALEAIDDDIILFVQEDFFLKAPIKNQYVEQFAGLMYNHPDIACIHLTRYSHVISEKHSEYKYLDVLKRQQMYRVCCQAALWRKEEIYTLLQDSESAWDFELVGSIRSAFWGREYLVVDSSLHNGESEIFPYIRGTGIQKGRWKEEVVELFKHNGIYIDFSERGFVGEVADLSIFKRTINRLSLIFKIVRCKMALIRRTSSWHH